MLLPLKVHLIDAVLALMGHVWVCPCHGSVLATSSQDTNEAVPGGRGNPAWEAASGQAASVTVGLGEGSCSAGRKSRWHTPACEGTGASFSLPLTESWLSSVNHLLTTYLFSFETRSFWVDRAYLELSV